MKLYADGRNNMNRLLNLLQTFSNDINMTFGIKKCAIIHINKGIVEKTNENLLPNLDPDTGYPYLGLLESSDFHQKIIKNETKNKYYNRVRTILKAQLNALNTALAMKLFAVPILRYSFGIIHWTSTELKQIDRKTRKILYQLKFHHPKSDCNNIYLSRNNGGRGIPCIEDIYSQELSNIVTYIEKNNDALLNEVKYYEACTTPSKSILRYKISGPNYRDKTKCDEIHKLLRNNKQIHGKFFNAQQNIPFADLNRSWSWLKKSYLRFETESLICAAQEQALMTNWKRKVCSLSPTNGKCRLCHTQDETIMHIVSGCKILANNLYTTRHDKVCQYVHWCILKKYNAVKTTKWYLHKPQRSIDFAEWTVTWDLPITTDIPIAHNRPDIVLHNRAEKTCLLIDVTIPQDQNIISKTAEKLRKYKPLEIELQKCWNLHKIQTIPIVIGALGTVLQNNSKYIEKVSDKINFNILQKTVLIGTQAILRNFLSP